MRAVSRSVLGRGASALATVAVLAGCEGPLDYDLRGQVGGFSTTAAALSATADRPTPDARGVITYPTYQVAVARRGDTVGAVAARVGLPEAELARFNGLLPSDQLREGEVLALPRSVGAGAGNVDIASIATTAIDQAPDTGDVRVSTLEPAKPAPVTSTDEPIRHKVKRGETAYTISRLYQVPVDALAEWNGLGPDFAVREGQYLLIPVKDQSAPRQAAAPAATAVTEPGQGSPTPTPPSATQPLPDEKIAPPAPAPDVTAEAPTQTSASALAMPVTGKIIRPYAKGKNEGIDIAGSPGTPVKAAEAGTVAAITADADQIPIIVVKHSNDLLTVYANVEGISVKKGDRVKRGQSIAKLRGGENAYVHFEVREGFESVDPETYLR
ncbi:Murein DD-endopeptidase MepM and murein hydrolase activator NlpD, contain LysM domain [Ruegeria intermedia]|uniref:Murein DD-endopeptidase MepM and murein hydrolase activator NlpD, contain LysM domain n=1 Tax=Ruegeria intermedia TaxID=996115 RepID=A0A1M4TJJ3_9RHOB|nr:peptidoglycan DD-metalloendopeptidase family protein [Ruegeria intermedia]SHE44514.1 Murein DD-endopeptidase MepM and murein hydrolase activator NlpD, contain LysM domain [Ruegeria intermedia]